MLNVHIGDPFGLGHGLGLGLECRRCAGEASPLTKHTSYTGDRDRDRDRDRTVYLQDVMHKLQMSKLNKRDYRPFSGVWTFEGSTDTVLACLTYILVIHSVSVSVSVSSVDVVQAKLRL